MGRTESVSHCSLVYMRRININSYTQAVVNPHTNLTEISTGLDLLWRNNINPRKVVLGLGFYGRSFTLADPSCTTPGCPFSGGASPGDCTKTSGVLSNAEIQRIIKDKGVTPIFDQRAGVKYIVWDNDQWVSYDDADTLKLKMDMANSLNLGGVSESLQVHSCLSVSDATQWCGLSILTTLIHKVRNF